MFKKTDKSPILVYVTSDRWDAAGDPTNPRHKFLYNYLAKMGGVNESVPPGWYDFNITRKGLTQVLVTLEPHQS